MAGMTESRNAAFQGGITSTGTHPATSIQQNVDPAFHPGSVLALPNIYKYPASLGEAEDTFARKMPLQMISRRIAGPSSDMSSPVMNY